MRRPYTRTATVFLMLAAMFMLAHRASRAESVRVGGALRIFSSSSRSRRDGRRGDRDRPRKRSRRDSFLLRPRVFRRESRAAHVVHVTGNGRLNMARSRTYVRGYKVTNGFLIPILGTVTRSVRFGVADDDDSESRSNRPDWDYLLRDAAEIVAAHRKVEPLPEPTVIVERGPIGPHTTSLVGTLKLNAEGELEFLAANPKGEDILYEMIWPEPARKVLAQAGTETLRIILIGQVNDENPDAVIRVTAAYPLAEQAG